MKEIEDISLKKFFVDNIKELVKIFLLPLAVFIMNIPMTASGLYFKIWWLDILMHFIGGFSIGISFTLLLLLMQNKMILGDTNKAVLVFIAISIVSFTALAWEYYEYLADYIFKTYYQWGLDDMLSDILFGLIGGFLATLITLKIKK